MKIKNNQLPKEWKYTKLKEICLKTSNIQWSSTSGEKYHYIDLSAVSRKTLQVVETVQVNKSNAPSRAKRVIKTGDVIFATTRPTLKRAAIIHRELNNQICSTGFTVLRPNFDKVLSRYVFYSLLLEDFMIRMEALQRGASYPAVTDTDVKNYEISLPPLSEQQRIVSTLDKSFEAIDKSISNAEKNLENAKDLFESYLQGVFEKLNQDYKPTSLGDTCEFFNGKAHEKDIDIEGEFIVVNSKFISQEGRIIKRTKEQMFPLFKNDIVMVMSDLPNGKALAKCSIIEEDDKYSLNQRICCIRSNKFEIKFLYHHLNRHPYLLSFNNGENQTNLRKGDILNIPLSLPPLNIQKEILVKLDEAKRLSKGLETIYQTKLYSLDELKKSVLQKAFRGELETGK